LNKDKIGKSTTYFGIENSFRDVSLSGNGPRRDAGHFVSFRDCPGQSGTPGYPSYDTVLFNSNMCTPCFC